MSWKGLTVHSRQAWGARPPRGRFSTHTLSAASPMVVHHSAGQGRRIESWKEQVATMQAIQRMHQDTNGWTDIGYHLVVFQPFGRLRRARVFEGRPLTAIPAAQDGANTGTVAVCVVHASGEPVKAATVSRLKSIYRRLPCGNVKGHRDFGATECPSDELYARLSQIRRAK